MFLGQVVDANKLLDDDVARLARYNPDLTNALDRLAGRFPQGINNCKDSRLPPSVFCMRFDKLRKMFEIVIKAPESISDAELLTAYQELRETGIYPVDVKFLFKIEERILTRPIK